MKQQIITLSFLLISWIGFSQKTFKLDVAAEGNFGSTNADVFRINTTVSPATTIAGVYQATNNTAGLNVLQDFGYCGNKALMIEKPSGVGRVIITSYPDLTALHTFPTSNAPQTLAMASATKGYVHMTNPRSFQLVDMINNTMTPVADANNDFSGNTQNMVYGNGTIYVQIAAKIVKIDTVTNAVSGVITPGIGTIAGIVFDEIGGKLWALSGTGTLISIDVLNGDALGTPVVTGTSGVSLLRTYNQKLYFWKLANKQLFIYDTQTLSTLPLTPVYTSTMIGGSWSFGYGRSFDVDKNTGDFVICSADAFVAPAPYEVVDGTTFTVIGSGSIAGAASPNRCYLQTFESPTPDLATLPTATGQCSVTLTAPTANGGTITATTTDPIVYSVQGDYVVTWTYENNGTTVTQTQAVEVHDVSVPVAAVQTLPSIEIACNVAITNFPTATDNCDLALTGTTTSPLTYATAGTYTLVWLYTDAAGNVTQQNQVVVVSCSTAGLADLTANSTLIYPNPATDFITLESTSLIGGKIFNINGQEVMSFNATSTSTDIQISHLPKGLYYVQLLSENNGISTQKLILE
ncbi:MAG: T9SS type A sorting domain-containing protein [Crocinitomicaceae bacterium]|nr:T9SS type A sorting domain-containing protein [Crocinitomicaceae bacterium]